MVFIYILIAILISGIWIHYFRKIDIFERERIELVLFTFFLGGLSVLFVLGLHNFLLHRFITTGEAVHDFFYYVFKVGLIEEIAKLIPLLIIIRFYKSELTEPIDYLFYICASALGFAAAENAMYFYEHGAQLFVSRGILSTVSHMFNSAVIAYGIIWYKYYHRKQNYIGFLLFFIAAAVSHGFYDFWLTTGNSSGFGWIVAFLYFLITVSVFASILNNALNNSPHFTYKKVVNTSELIKQIFLCYLGLYVIQTGLLCKEFGYEAAFGFFNQSLKSIGIILVITVVRLNRFKLVKGRWNPIRIELPFRGGLTSSIQIKGVSYDESYISQYFQENCLLIPLSPSSTYIRSARNSYIYKKLLLKNDDSFFAAKIYESQETDKHEIVYLKPKTNQSTLISGMYPIVAILKTKHSDEVQDGSHTIKDFYFKEWAFIKPLPEPEIVLSTHTQMAN